MRKLLVFIVNPFSGTTSKSDFEKLVQNHLDHSQFDFIIHYTEYPLHAKELSSSVVDESKAYAVIAVGGDGTVNEVAESLINSEVCLGVIPAGSGNGFGSHIGMSRNIGKSINILNQSHVTTIDTGLYNGERSFVNVAGVGFDARIVHHSKQDKKRGFINYFKTTIGLLPQYKPTIAKITLEGEEVIEGSYASIVVANASTYGYNFKIAPDASFTDGVFDLVLIKDVPIYRYFLYSPLYFTKGARNLDFLDIRRCKSVKIETSENGYFHLDGEGIKGKMEYQFDLIPHSLKILSPRA
jgi:diacylglycerol kinase (ATP)